MIDDLEGRRCAETHRIRLRETLVLVLRAKRQRVSPEARPVLHTLRAPGMTAARWEELRKHAQADDLRPRLDRALEAHAGSLE